MPETKTAATPIVVSAHEYKHQQATAAMAESLTLNMDVAPEGGRYLLPDGKTMVDANGEPVKGQRD